MLLKSLTRVCACTRYHIMVWSKKDYECDNSDCLDSFMLDYTEKGEKFDNPFWRYVALKELGATVKTISPWDKLTVGIIVIVDSEFAYRDRVDKLLSENGLLDYVRIK